MTIFADTANPTNPTWVDQFVASVNVGPSWQQYKAAWVYKDGAWSQFYGQAVSLGPTTGYLMFGGAGADQKWCTKWDGANWSNQTDGPTPARSQLAGTAFGTDSLSMCGYSILTNLDSWSGSAWTSLTAFTGSGKYGPFSGQITSKAYLYYGTNGSVGYKVCDSWSGSAWASETAPPSTGLQYDGAMGSFGSQVYRIAGNSSNLNESFNAAAWTTNTALPGTARIYNTGGATSAAIYTISGSATPQTVQSWSGSAWASETSMPSAWASNWGCSVLTANNTLCAGYGYGVSANKNYTYTASAWNLANAGDARLSSYNRCACSSV